MPSTDPLFTPASAQLPLPGFDAAPHATDRLFFAIVPDPETAARIARLARQVRLENGARRKPLATSRFHVTLHHLGDHAGLPADVVASASEAAASMAMPPFELAFDRVASFSGRPGNRPWVLRGGAGLAALVAFQQALGAALRKAGLGRFAEPHFTPHLTLLYGHHGIVEQPVETVRWTAHEVVLVRSLIGLTEHLPLGRWPLGGAAPQP